MPDLITALAVFVSSLIAFVTINPIYNLSLDINITNPKLSANENLNISVFLQKTNLTNINEIIEVNLDYEIIKARKSITSGSLGTIEINDSVKEIFTINTSNLTTGKYTLKAEATHAQSNPSQDSEAFSKATKKTLGSKRNPLTIFDTIKSFLRFE